MYPKTILNALLGDSGPNMRGEVDQHHALNPLDLLEADDTGYSFELILVLNGSN